MTFNIPSFRMDWLESQIKSLNKRAAKLGSSPISMDVTGHHFTSVKVNPLDEISPFEMVDIRINEVEIDGQAPVLNGWKFLAVVEHITGENGNKNFFRAIPESDIPERYRTASADCEHCNLNRMRKDTYLVKHEETGEVKQVGSGCLKDFTGHSTPEMMGRLAEAIFDLFNEVSREDDGWFNEGSGISTHYQPLIGVMTAAVAVIEKFGWVSRGSTYDETGGRNGKVASADLVESHLNPMGRVFIDNPVTEQEWKRYAKTAQDVIDFVRAISEDGFSNYHNDENGEYRTVKPNGDYLWNLTAVFSEDYIRDTQIGVAVSGVTAYERHLAELNKQADWFANSKHIGEVKSRQDFNLVLRDQFHFASDYGVTHILKFSDENDNLFVWFSSRDFDSLFSEYQRLDEVQNDDDRWIENYSGNVITLKATIKEHSERDGIKQTIITRGKIMDIKTEGK